MPEDYSLILESEKFSPNPKDEALGSDNEQGSSLEDVYNKVANATKPTAFKDFNCTESWNLLRKFS
jgi:hypothetical protein